MSFNCWCASEECAVMGCKRHREIRERYANSTKPVHDRLQGCICPPGAEKTCKGASCPRKSAGDAA